MQSPEVAKSPVPNQMVEVAAILACTAKLQGKIKESQQYNNAQFFMPKYIDNMHESNDRIITSSFIGRVARHGEGRLRHWSMKVVEKIWTMESSADEEDAARLTYSFAWNSQRVTQAERTIWVKPDNEDQYDPDYFQDNDMMFSPAMLAVAQEMKVVSSKECTDLAHTLRAFSSVSQNILHYNR